MMMSLVEIVLVLGEEMGFLWYLTNIQVGSEGFL